MKFETTIQGDTRMANRQLRAAVLLSCAGFGVGSASISVAQQDSSGPNAGSSTTLQEIVVTGSHIRRTDIETPSPVQVVTAEQLHESGLTSTQDVLHNLTANGQGTLSQGFSGAFASGAAGIALRGLNVGDTLVLIDGHRSAPYPIGDDGYRSFVDIANLPFDAIDRIEVLKDGASAVYGSDAIAGVVNIILKKTYEGAQVTADSGISSHGDGSQFHVSAIAGLGNLESDGHNAYMSAEFKKTNEIKFEDRGGQFTQHDYTAQGGIDFNYGAQSILTGSTPSRSATGYVTDPNGNIVGFMPGCNATKFAANQCIYGDTWDQLQVPTENTNVVGRFTQKLNDTWQVSFEGTFFESKAEQVNRPDRAFTGGYQGIATGPGIGPTLLTPVGATTIPDTNPSYPAGTGLTVANLRYTFLNLGPTITLTDAKTYREVLEVEGKAAGWDIEAAAGYTEVDLDLTGLNYVSASNLQTALNSTTAPFLVGQPNSAAVDNFVAPPLYTTQTSKLAFGHAGASRELLQLPGGPFGMAVGVDYYARDQYAVAPPAVENGIQGTGDFSNNYTVGAQRVGSGYLEFDAPIVKQLEMNAAVRYDNYNLSGGRASPKIGFKFTPIPQVALRGTASTGFRAPGPGENGQAGQTFFAGTIADPILCKNPANPTAAGNFAGQCNVQIPGLQASNPALRPETSKSFTLGLVIEPISSLSATFDIYNIEVDHQIVPGNASATVVRGNNLTPIPEYQANGTTLLVTPPVAPIAYYGLSYVNANTTTTNGFDLGLRYHAQFDNGLRFKSEATWSYIHLYDIKIAGVTYHLAGTHGPTFY
ncbi:MAG TPA: TonB-dependent receptor, partial [Mycobacterium sp.]|nr:TonB-dependent receptor [Mycobacterium sp.]